VELQVEKNPLTCPYNVAHQLRALRGKQLAPDLEHPHQAAQLLYQSQGRGSIRHVKRNHQPISWCLGILVDHDSALVERQGAGESL
jgi:hypothetical protein